MAKHFTLRTEGFESFRQGTFRNAGQNLYVSRAGILQRIHQFDLNRDGYFDMIFCNSQEHWESPPAYVYLDPLSSQDREELPSDGACAGVVADLNGDGYDDLVLAAWDNGVRSDLNATIYYGAEDGWSERRIQKLPAPSCIAAAAGQVRRDGRPALVLLCGAAQANSLEASYTRLFEQTDLGFEPKRYEDLSIIGQCAAMADLDGDACAELLVRRADGRVIVYWGGSRGTSKCCFDELPVPLDSPRSDALATDGRKYTEYVADAWPLVKAVTIGGRPHVFVARRKAAYLVPVKRGRRFGRPIVLEVSEPMSVAVGDLDGDGKDDLVLACRDREAGGERSWVYWDCAGGPSESRRSELPTNHASDVAVGDLDGDGRVEAVFSQGFTVEHFTGESLLFRWGRRGEQPESRRLLSHDARQVLMARPDRTGQVRVVLVNFRARNRIGDVKVACYLGGPDGFRPDRKLQLRGRDAVAALCCDLDDDGRVDVVLANCCENSPWDDTGSFVFIQGEQGLPQEPTMMLPTVRAHGVACADLNRDGHLDLVFAGFDNPDLLVFYGTRDGFDLERPARIHLEKDGVECREPRWIYLADLDNDGWLDLFVPLITQDRSLLLWGGPDGFTMQRSRWLSVGRAACARAADLTGNGYLDLVVGGHIPTRQGPHDSFVYIYWNGPDGLREDNRTLLPAKGVNALCLADLNGDGLLDLFVCSYHDGRERDIDSYIYWNRPGRGFSASDRTPLRTHSASGCLAADFNEDGYVDLAVANHKVHGDHLGCSAVWWNGPGGFDPARTTQLPTAGPHGMVVVEPGNIADRGEEEHYVSAPLHLGSKAAVRCVRWEAELGPKTWVRAQLRFARSRHELERAAWIGGEAEGGWLDSGQPVPRACQRGPWVQYRLALGARLGMSTPRVRAVELECAKQSRNRVGNRHRRRPPRG